MPCDEDLMGRVREGDREALQQLLDRHGSLLEAYIQRRLPAILSRKLSASDVAQETRLVVHKRRRDYDPEIGSFRKWLLGIADHKIREALRCHTRAKRAANREVSRGLRVDTAQFKARGPTPSQVAVASEMAEIAREALQMLPEDYREILRLARDHGLGLAEVAGRMKRSPEAVRKLYGRALCRFREAFEKLRGDTDA
jgi:RNA polymerase sigma-70 factor, ECF subfamily